MKRGTPAATAGIEQALLRVYYHVAQAEEDRYHARSVCAGSGERHDTVKINFNNFRPQVPQSSYFRLEVARAHQHTHPEFLP